MVRGEKRMKNEVTKIPLRVTRNQILNYQFLIIN